jgi:hypothetical protein
MVPFREERRCSGTTRVLTAVRVADDGGKPVPCCARCAAVARWSYELEGDGDGIEFLVETAQLLDGCESTSVVVYRHQG